MRRPGRRALWLVVPPLVGLVGWGWWLGLVAQRNARRELAELQVRREKLERATQALAREVAALKREPAARERAAREALDVARPDEVLVIVPPQPATRGAK
ncbi:MAG: septum formation initiator family protein [Thermoanaerobaculales bacterium]